MKIIRFSHSVRVTATASIQDADESPAWLSAMGDRGWRMLIGFRNWPSWIPGMREVQQLDQKSPARGTLLRIVRSAGAERTATIEHWDPPRRLAFSVEAVAGELAYGFTIREIPKESSLLITLELERSIRGWARPLAFFFHWQLRQLGTELLSTLRTRMRPPQL